MADLRSRIIGKYRRTLAYRFHRRMVTIRTSVPIISFTFDDAPRTAFDKGGDILRSYGAKATFFISLGLLGSNTEVGTIASLEDLVRAVNEGNELGCHTFDHLNTWETTSDKFVESVVRNKQALDRVLPGATFRTFSYPIGSPKPSIKSRLEKYFVCCRGGGQAPNVGAADLNLLKAYFLDKKNNFDIGLIKKIIDYSTSCCGWLIFVTHDIIENPSPYGCTPKFFEEVVNHAARSGALLLPVEQAFEKLQTSNNRGIPSK